MPSPNANSPVFRNCLGMAICVGLWGLLFYSSGWEAAVQALPGLGAVLWLSFSWTRKRERQRAEEAFLLLNRWMEEREQDDVPSLPDEYREAAELARTIQRRVGEARERSAVSSAALSLLHVQLEALPEGFLAVDEAETILTLNSQARRLLGLADGCLAGRHLAEVVRLPGFHQLVGECRKKRQPGQRELRLGDKAGRVLNAHCAPVSEAGGLVILFTDITYFSRTEEFRRDFVSNVSHELRTPVTSIQGYSETLLDSPEMDEKTRTKFIEVISRQAVRLNHIIEDILELSRLEHDANGFVFETAPILPILQATLETCSARAAEKSITLKLGAVDAISADVNSSLLEQALTNLVTNAVKYSPEQRQVTLSADSQEGVLHISVEDNGIGIAAEHLPRLFERFYRVDKARSRSVGGTGLGLAIVRQVALLHLGDVSVSSVPGTGSVFTLKIPLKRPLA